MATVLLRALGTNEVTNILPSTRLLNKIIELTLKA
jgi:hypothetical protein